MEWLAIIILCIQFGWISPCVFDKVEVVPGEVYEQMPADESGCFAVCYKHRKCIALAYQKFPSACALYKTGKFNETCIPNNVCYTLQRDEEDSMCARYLNV